MKLLVALIALGLSAPVAAQQTEFGNIEEYHVYRESKGCVLYADYVDDSMVRVSNRTDEHRVYFSIYNAKWASLAANEGQTVMLSIQFDKGNNHGTSAVIVRNPDGRMGFSGADLANEDFLTDFAASYRYKVVLTGAKPVTLLYADAGKSHVAVGLLRSCSKKG